jgi:DNA polymerase II small subunit
MREKVLKVLLDHGTLIEPEAADFILGQRDPVGFISNFLDTRRNLPLILTVRDLQPAAPAGGFSRPPAPAQAVQEHPQTQGILQTDASEIPGKAAVDAQLGKHAGTKTGPGYHIISDVTGSSTCNGSIENFTQYFRDRFRVLRRIIRSHAEMGASVKIAALDAQERETRVIGMIMDVSKTKNGHIGLTIEDDTGELFVLIHRDSDLVSETFLKDEVMGFTGRLSRGKGGNGPAERKNGMFIASAVRRPGIPTVREQRRSSEDVEVVFMSDIHAGSSHFLPEAWSRFMDWMNSPQAAKVGYAVVSGDLVDGIGVYPNQEEELLIHDIYQQYDELAKLLSCMPERIRVFLQPGNHDAVRPAEPQPAIPEKFRKGFGQNFTFIGNPCHLDIAGVEILSYHGKSIDDLVGQVPGVTYLDPILPMHEMLKRRLLTVSYGGKTPLAPEARDYMAINPIPDILVTGHVHRTAIHRTGGMTLINSSAWQSQTPFQKTHNFNPDPAKIVVVNLKTGRCRMIDFLNPAK